MKAEIANISKMISLDGYGHRQAERDRLNDMHERHFPPTRDLLMPLFKGMSVLDFGCGLKGSFHFLGTKEGVTTTGLDYDLENPNARYHSWEEVGEKYDAVLFQHVLEHMPYDVSISHIKRALTIAPLVVIVVPNGGENPFIHQRNQDITHLCAPYNMVDFSILLEHHGIKVKRLIRSDIYNQQPDRVWIARLLFAGILATSPFHDYVIICEASE